MNLNEAKKILKDAGFLIENIDDVSSREELIEMILEHPCRDENITLEILKTWSFEELEKYHEECEEKYMDDVYGLDRDGIDEAKELLDKNGYLIEKEEGNFYSVRICYIDKNGEIASTTLIEFTNDRKLAEAKALAKFKKKFEYETIKWIDSEELNLKEAKELLRNNGYILERYDLDYDSVNSSFDEEKRLEKFGEYLYEVRELLVRKGFSRGKQADNYDELHDIAHRCCRLGKSIEDCAKEIILTIK